MEHMYSQQLLEQFKAGKREFNNIFLRFCELNNTDLSGIIFRNSKIEYARFWFSNLKGAKFINCDIYFSAFYTANLDGAVFDNCTIDMVRFDSAIPNGTKIINSRLSYCLATGINLGAIDFQGSSLFRMITNPNMVTDEDISDALKIIGNRAEDLPIEIKSAIIERVEGMAKNFNRDIKLQTHIGRPYGSHASSPANLYNAINSFTDEIIKYGSSDIYKSKKKDIYRN